MTTGFMIYNCFPMIPSSSCPVSLRHEGRNLTLGAVQAYSERRTVQ